MANDTQPFPLTIAAPMEIDYPPTIVIGKNTVPFGAKPSGYGGYRILAIDRRTLEVPYNAYTQEYDQAPGLGQYDTTDYLLVVSSVGLGTGHVPQGAFYDFLYDNGAGKELKRIVQLNETLGCGTYGWVAYVLVGLLGPGKPDVPGIEASLLTGTKEGLVLALQLVPVDISGTTYYTPAPLSD